MKSFAIFFVIAFSILFVSACVAGGKTTSGGGQGGSQQDTAVIRQR